MFNLAYETHSHPYRNWGKGKLQLCTLLEKAAKWEFSKPVFMEIMTLEGPERF